MKKVIIIQWVRCILKNMIRYWHGILLVADYCNRQLIKAVPRLNALVDRLVYLVGNQDQQKEASLEKPHKLLGYYKDGFRYGDLASSQETSFRHTAIFGKTGSGKGIYFFENNYLVDRYASMVIRDVPGDCTKAAGFWHDSKCSVVLLNLTDAWNNSTHTINVLEGEMTKADIGRIADIIVSCIYKNQHDFWITSAKEACIIFLEVLKNCLAEEYHNLHNLKFLITSFMADSSSINSYVVKGSDELNLAFAALASTPEKSLLSTMSTLKSCFNNLDESTTLLTSSSSFKWRDIRKEKTVVVIQSSVMDDTYHTLVQNLLFTSLLREMMSEIPTETDLSVNIFLDEVTSLGAIGKSLETSFLNLRKYRCALAIGAQSESSLESAFGKPIAQSVIANCYSRLYLPGMDLQTANYLEKYIGTHEIEDENGRMKTESVVNAFSLRTMKEKGVLLIADQPASIIPLKPYFKNFRMKRRLKLPMPDFAFLKDILDTPEILTIPINENESDTIKNNTNA